MTHKPVVGVTSDWNKEPGGLYLRVDREILKWLRNEGIVPLVFPPLPGSEDLMLETVSAVVIPGGRDILPKFYGAFSEEEHEEEFCHKDRTAFEIALLWRSARLGVPVLGICNGCQAVNVAFGGDLVFHLDDPRQRHRKNGPPRPVTHRVHPEEGSFLGEMKVTKDTRVSSSHHQAIGRVADSFKVTAYGPDRVIETIESDEFPLIKGVQWHPERTPHSPLSRRLAKWLKEKALQRSAGK